MSVLGQPVEIEQTGAPDPGDPIGRHLRRAKAVSYWVMCGMIIFVGVARMGAPFLALLFSYYILKHLRFLKQRWLTVVIFLALVTLACAGLAFTLDQTIKNLPQVVSKAIPAIIQTAKEHGLALPFSDWESLKEFALESAKSELRLVGVFARSATRTFVFLIIGIVIATSLYLTPFTRVLGQQGGSRQNLYTLYGNEIAERFRSFFESFARVMGAQLIISTINTGLTAIFIISVGLPYAALAIGITFLCGLLPIVGNLLSNSVLVAIGFTVSPKMAIFALGFLVVLHKLEYFLNSKIIGKQIKNPVWLTLIGLIVGERLMGITGMILAPVILDYIRVEASRFKAPHIKAEELQVAQVNGEERG